MRNLKFRLLLDGEIVGYEKHHKKDVNGVMLLDISYFKDIDCTEHLAAAPFHDEKHQNIGRKGKNDTEVYERDLIECSMSFEGGTLPHMGEIVYSEEFGAFGTKNDAGITLLHNHCLHTLKVIGNLSTNPEILERPWKK